MIRRFARPYAKALSEIVPDPKEAQRLHAELESFEKARAGSSELSGLLANPAVAAETKVSIVNTIAGRLQLSTIPRRTLEVLVKNHRINQLQGILDAWLELINRSLNIAVADVRAAHSLSEAEAAKLREALQKRFGRTVQLKVETDPSLLGGFVATVGNEIYDASVLGQINRFRESLA